MDKETKIKRLIYRSSHRGWKETDLILGGFADENLTELSDEQLDIYEQFLEESDADIWDWLVGKLPPKSQDYTPLLEMIKAYRQVKK